MLWNSLPSQTGMDQSGHQYLAICGVKDIGRRSSSIIFGCNHLGVGETIDDFSSSGIFPCLKVPIQMSDTTGDNSKAKSRSILSVISSGLADFWHLTSFKARYTLYASQRTF